MLSKMLIKGKLFFVGVSALLLAACGDSGGGKDALTPEEDGVETIGDLPGCTENCEGNQAFPLDPCENSQCADNQWNSVEERSDAPGSFATQSSSSRGSSSSSGLVEYGTLTDSRDGQIYKTVTIGTQTWMAQNLNYETANSYCFNDSTKYCEKYGRLYMWGAATTACPTGWHLPTKEEFETLFTAVGGQSTASKILKSTSGWNNSGNGTDAYLFSALPAGYRNGGGEYISEGSQAYFWSSTESNSNFVFNIFLHYNSGKAEEYVNLKDVGFSVRCVKGESAEKMSSSSSGITPKSSSSVKSSSSAKSSSSSVMSSSSSAKSSSSSVMSSSSSAKSSSSSAKSSSSSVARSSSSSAISSSSKGSSSSSSLVEYGTLTDSRDGQTYKTVTIGTQTWMAQNLNYKTANSYCYDDKASNCTKYGRLYTWAAAMDSAGRWSLDGRGCGYYSSYSCSPRYPVQGVCPVGWHLPSVSDWTPLLTAVGGRLVGTKFTMAGTKLKSQSGWNSNGNGDDAFGFSALPAGIRWGSSSGTYLFEGEYAYFWSSVNFGDSHAYYMYLDYSDDGAGQDTQNYKSDAISVRCLRN